MQFGKEKSGIQVFLRWMFYLFIAYFPFMFSRGFLFQGTSTRAIDTFIFAEILAIVVGVALLGRTRASFVKSPITLSLLLLLAVLFVSSILGVDFHTSFWSLATRTTGLFYFIHIALLYVFFWVAFSETKRFRQFILVFLIASGLFSLLTFIGYDGAKLVFSGQPWPGFTIGNSTFAGMYIYLAFMVSIYYIATQPEIERRWWKYLLPLVFVISPYIIDFDLWRGNINVLQHPLQVIGSAQASAITLFLSVGILVAVWLLSKLKEAKTRRTILFTGFGVGILILIVAVRSLITTGGTVQKVYLTQSSATRPIVWEFSQKAIAERPLLGWGVDNFEKVFQKYYDNRILEKKNGGEGWLDRAHNIIVDQTVETGYIGLLAYLLVYATLFGCLLYVIVKSKDRSDQIFGVVFLVYFFGHLLELQTAFDTSISYVPLICITAVTAIIFARTRAFVTNQTNEYLIPKWIQYTGGSLLAIGAIILFSIGTVPILRAESANGAVRTAHSSEKRLPIYKKLFSSPLDEGAFLWRTSSDIQRGVYQDQSVLSDPVQREGFKKELASIIANYNDYLSRNPNDYRVTINLADTYIYERLFDIDELDKAHTELDKAVQLVPQAPQAYWMQAVTYLYQKKFDLAKQWAQRAYDLNPNIEESQRLMKYINDSIKTFPVIDLYTFKQI